MVKLICYNIEYCEGMEGLWYQYLQFWKVIFPPIGLDQKIVNALKTLNPDILALVEVDTGSIRSRKKDEAKFFEKELGMKSIVERVKYPINGWLKLFHYIPILSRQSNAITSKYEFSEVKQHMFREGVKRTVIEATIKCPKKVTLLLAHLALGTKTRAAQIKELISIVNNCKNPVILMGDFNTFNGSKELDELLKETHLSDKTKINQKTNKQTNKNKHSTRKSNEQTKINQINNFTQPTYHPSRRLDYILTSQQIKIKKYDVLNYHFSDHMPLYVEFDVK